MRIAASVLHSGQVTGGFRNMLQPQISYECAEEANWKAGVDPEDLDVVELHDSFTTAELLYYEGLGLFPVGLAGRSVGAHGYRTLKSV